LAQGTVPLGEEPHNPDVAETATERFRDGLTVVREAGVTATAEQERRLIQQLVRVAERMQEQGSAADAESELPYWTRMWAAGQAVWEHLVNRPAALGPLGPHVAGLGERARGLVVAATRRLEEAAGRLCLEARDQAEVDAQMAARTTAGAWFDRYDDGHIYAPVEGLEVPEHIGQMQSEGDTAWVIHMRQTAARRQAQQRGLLTAVENLRCQVAALQSELREAQVTIARQRGALAARQEQDKESTR